MAIKALRQFSLYASSFIHREYTTMIQPKTALSVMDAIYQRRAVRAFTSQKVDETALKTLLDTAVHAPTAIHEEPWSFAVIQDKSLLHRLSESAKTTAATEAAKLHLAGIDRLTSPEFSVFYNAGTLIVIYGKPMGPFVVADCWLAAENLMLAACSMGLGSCVIGLAVAALNTPEWKKEFNITAGLVAYAPIIVGVPEGSTPVVPRKAPEIVIRR
jgi:nitroreductase